MKPRLTYLRPSLGEVPERFHNFLLDSTQCWLEEYFVVTNLEQKAFDDSRIDIPEGTDIIFLQVIPELGFENYEYNFNRRNIPLAIYLSVDSISPCRYAAFKFSKSLDADAYFVNDLSMGLRYPIFRDKLFYLPWFIPLRDLSRPEGAAKDIFMLLVGHNKGTYPWRNKLFPKFKAFYNAEQLGYFAKYGREYLKELSKAKYIPTDGGFGRIIVNKHFEIPASFSCLITQPTTTVTLAGYKDMVNCIMAENFEELETKIKICEENPELYSSIVKEGYDLVVNHHTEKGRPQLYEWYLLNKSKKREETIVQPSPFGSLKLTTSTLEESFRLDFTDDSVITKEIDELIGRKNYQLAYQKCQFLIDEYLEYSPDFIVRKAVVCIHTKKLREAVKSLWRLMNFELYLTRGKKPEPIEWSLLLLSLYLANQRAAVKRMLAMFEFETEPFYNYTKFFILRNLCNKGAGSKYLARSYARDGRTESAHSLVPSKVEDIQSWIDDIAGTIVEQKSNISTISENDETKKAPLYKYFLIEYYCLLFAEGDSLKNKLKCKARLTRSRLKSLNNRQAFK